MATTQRFQLARQAAALARKLARARIQRQATGVHSAKDLHRNHAILGNALYLVSLTITVASCLALALTLALPYLASTYLAVPCPVLPKNPYVGVLH